ncbi:MAG: DUF349 domain-containing protein [Acidimicrobiia bacterium]|nr:DUF349 domain-containing protein [Acidimicrobiia bacterium]
MGILDKLKPQPRWKHSDPAVRLEAVRELADDMELAEVAETDADPKVRRAAVARIVDPTVLGRCIADADQSVKDEAADQLAALALDGSDPARAVASANLLTDSRRLANLAKSATSEASDAVRESALARISDDRQLAAVARHAKVEAIAMSALGRVTSADELLDTVLNSDHKDVALAAFDRVVDANAPDLTQLKSIEGRSQQKAASKRARTMLQAIEDAENARRAAEDEQRRQETLLCDAVEGAAAITDADRAEADLSRLETAWQAITSPDPAAAKRFTAGAAAIRVRIAEKRREVEAAAEMARQRGEAIASREALCQRVETIEGDDILAQLAPIEEEWASLTPLVGNGPDATRLNDRFTAAVASCRKRHALGATLVEHRATLETLVVEAEALPAWEDAAAAGTRWPSLAREASVLVDALAGASRPATDLADRLSVVSRAFEAREAAARETAAKARQDLAVRVQRLTERAKRVAEAEAVTLREGERLMRDVTAMLDEVGTGESSKEIADAAAALRVQQEAVAPKVKELRDMDEWRRFANAQQQEQLIAMAEAIVASLKADEEAGKTSELAATAKALREFHLRWQEVADAPRHSAQRLWDRFKTATDFIRSRCEVYFAKLKEERGGNLERKQALVEESEKLAESTDWAKAAARFQELQTEWQAVGPVPRDAARDLAQRFRTACNTFFTRRRDDLSSKKKEWNDNLEKKEALCARAEALAESTDWDAASAELKRMQAEWKTIGPVRRNKSEVVWNRFRAAADLFFERYHNRHRIALQGKVAEYEGLVVSLEGLAALHEAPADLAAQVQNLRATIQQNPPAPSDALKALQERWKTSLATLTQKFPTAFAGTDLDPAAIIQRMQKLVAKIEALIDEDEKPASTAGKSATELLAERLRSALTSNAMGKRADDSKWRIAATAVDDAKAAWHRLAPVPSEEATTLEAKFKAACKRVMDQVKLHVSPPVGAPGGGFGGGRPGNPSGSRGQGSRVQGSGPGSKGPRREDRALSAV